MIAGEAMACGYNRIEHRESSSVVAEGWNPSYNAMEFAAIRIEWSFARSSLSLNSLLAEAPARP
jgi:hypothetical protein